MNAFADYSSPDRYWCHKHRGKGDWGRDKGRGKVILIDCNIDGGVLAKFDAEGEYLEEDMDFTFEDFKIVEEFNKIDGM